MIDKALPLPIYSGYKGQRRAAAARRELRGVAHTIRKEGTAMKRCPHCHSPITQPDRKTCPVCGNPLSGPAGAARRRLPPWVPVVLLSVVAVVVVYCALH